MSRQFKASLEKLHEMLNYVKNQITDAGFKGFGSYQIELAVQEVLVNIITYAYKNKEGFIELECEDKYHSFSIIIRDQGYPYNPLNSGRMFEIPFLLEGKPIGGFGIFLILKNIDEIKYHYEEGNNTLTLVKYKYTQ